MGLERVELLVQNLFFLSDHPREKLSLCPCSAQDPGPAFSPQVEALHIL